MRFFTFLLSFFSVVTLTNAQSFSVQYDSLSSKVDINETINYIANSATNNSGEEKVLRWTQNRIFSGSKWTLSQVCDNIQCYLPQITTRTVKLAAGESTLLKLQFEPKGQDTCGYYTITVKEDGSSETGETAHYFFNGESCSALNNVTRLNNVETVQIFPNPSVDYVQLSTKEAVKNLKIYDSKGVIVKQIFDYNNGLIPVKELSAGTYYMMFDFLNGKTGVSKLFKN